MGRREQAVTAARRALELDPLSLVSGVIAGWTLWFAQHYEESLGLAQTLLEIDTHFGEGFRLLGLSHWGVENYAAAEDALQDAYNRFRRTRLGRALEPVWSNMALHRPAEFNKSHIPAFLADEEPRAYVCVYPFVRSYDWYLLPDEDRRRMLADHGKMARGFPDVRANTVASFALGDYEWLLAFEADELHRIVDLMRHLRASEARLHVREEVPFYTGRRKPVADLVAELA